MIASGDVPTPPSGQASAVAEQLLLTTEVDVPVLITAESPVERQTCARAIHDAIHGDQGPFVTVDAASLENHVVPAQSLERGCGGTLYLDDVAELGAGAQAHLLAWLEERAQSPLWSRADACRGLRLIAGASRHLERECASGIFCERLFYRLNIIHIDLTGSADGAAMKAREVMTTPIYTCRSDTNLADMTRLMWDHDCGFIPVVDAAGAVKGVITDRDICIAAATRGRPPQQLTAGDVMSSTVRAVFPDESIRDVLAAMQQFSVRRIPVIDAGGRLQGVVSMNDIVVVACEPGGPAAREVIATMAAICRHRPAGATLP
jgi:CBS domain-containing protein